MLDAQRRWRSSREGQEWSAKRQQLPVVQIQAGLLAALADHDLVVVGGDTGCGKTTQACSLIGCHESSESPPRISPAASLNTLLPVIIRKRHKNSRYNELPDLLMVLWTRCHSNVAPTLLQTVQGMLCED